MKICFLAFLFHFLTKTGREGQNGSISRFLESYITFDPCWPRQALICISWTSNRIGHKNKDIQLKILILTQELIELLVLQVALQHNLWRLWFRWNGRKGLILALCPHWIIFHIACGLSEKLPWCLVYQEKYVLLGFSLMFSQWLAEKQSGSKFHVFGVLHNVLTPCWPWKWTNLHKPDWKENRTSNQTFWAIGVDSSSKNDRVISFEDCPTALICRISDFGEIAKRG